MSQPNQTTVTFINMYSLTRLYRTTLTTLPGSGDFIQLGELSYTVAWLSWTFDLNGLTAVDVLLRPGVDEQGEPRFSYPEEDTLWQRWLADQPNSDNEGENQ